MKPTRLNKTKYHKSYTPLSMRQTPVQRAEITTSKRMFSSLPYHFSFFILFLTLATCGYTIVTASADEICDAFLPMAEQGDADAQSILAICYESVSKDYVKAVYWYTKAAEQGVVHAQFWLGFWYSFYDEGPEDYVKAAYWFTKAAEQGDAEAQFWLGLFYDKGYGVRKDTIKAAYWFTLAAEQGHASAQGELGYYYSCCDEITRDYTKAVYWYTKAAEQGDARAQYNLGICYDKGYGVAKNKTKAIYWYTKAAEQGYADATKALRNIK